LQDQPISSAPEADFAKAFRASEDGSSAAAASSSARRWIWLLSSPSLDRHVQLVLEDPIRNSFLSHDRYCSMASIMEPYTRQTGFRMNWPPSGPPRSHWPFWINPLLASVPPKAKML